MDFVGPQMIGFLKKPKKSKCKKPRGVIPIYLQSQAGGTTKHEEGWFQPF